MKRVLFIIALFICSNTIAQGEANIWYFGQNAGIDFSSCAPEAIFDGQLNTLEGCSSFSDADGNLLFYSDGTTVWNAQHQVMSNSKNLLGNPSSTQSAMIIPKPGSSTIYYIFTVGDNQNAGFHYTTIDMANGLGNIVNGPIDLTNEDFRVNWTERIAAVIAGDKKSYWVVTFVLPNKFYAYKVTSDGVNTTPVKSSTVANGSSRGYLKISPNGKKMAIAHMGTQTVALYDFDDITGTVSNEKIIFFSERAEGLPPLPDPISYTSTGDPFQIPFDTNSPYGVEFSANSQKLYVHASNDYFNDNGSEDVISNHWSTLYQFDVSLPVPEIYEERVELDTQNLYRGALQLGPDKKIYRSLAKTYNSGIPFLSVIENPEADGLACNYQHATISLGNSRSTQGLPPFIASIFSQIEITAAGNNDIVSSIINGEDVYLCEGDSFKIEPKQLTGNITYAWYKNDNPTPFTNQKDLNFNNITNSLDGDYKLVVTRIDNCDITTTLEGQFSLTAVPIPIANKPDNIVACVNDGSTIFSFDLSQQIPIITNGQNDVEVSFYSSQNDADEANNALPLLFDTETTTVYARIESINSKCYDITSFEIILNLANTNSSENIPMLSVCDDTTFGTTTDGIVIADITVRNSDVLMNLNTADFTFAYFTDDAYLNEIGTPTNFQNTVVGGQTIYVRTINNADISCIGETSFEMKVAELPILTTTPYILEQCDDDFDGFNIFNLTQVNTDIISTITTETFTYYKTESDANSGNNPITDDTNYTNKTANTDTIWARIENENSCFRIAEAQLIVKPSSIPLTLATNFNECDTGDDITDGIATFDFSNMISIIKNEYPVAVDVYFYKNENDAIRELNAIENPSEHQNIDAPFKQEIWVRVDSELGNDCLGNEQLITLIVNPIPQFEVEEERIVCLNLAPTILEALNPSNDYNYVWTNESNTIISTAITATISQEGVYTVVATNPITNCISKPKTVIVSASKIAEIDIDDIIIIDDSENNSITIITENNNLGIGNYQFALDDPFGFYQDSPIFEFVSPEIHTLYVKDLNGCGIAELEIPIIGFPQFFTPNNDGYNDTWQIKGASNSFAASPIRIFDRFGKIIAKIEISGNGWDGYYNGVLLPSDDYWFQLQITDQNGIIKDRKGHFSLIRR